MKNQPQQAHKIYFSDLSKEVFFQMTLSNDEIHAKFIDKKGCISKSYGPIYIIFFP